MNAHADALSVAGVHIVPHVQGSEMQYRRKPDLSVGVGILAGLFPGFKVARFSPIQALRYE